MTMRVVMAPASFELTTSQKESKQTVITSKKSHNFRNKTKMNNYNEKYSQNDAKATNGIVSKRHAKALQNHSLSLLYNKEKLTDRLTTASV